MIQDLNPYPAYRDSGVPWLGPVPEHWEVSTLRRYLRVKSGDMISADDETESGIPIYGGNGVRGYTSKSNCTGPIILLGRVGAKCGCVHLVNGTFWASEHALQVIPLKEVCLPFLSLVLQHLDLNQFAIRTAQPLINSTIVRERRFAFPPLSEQAAMDRFLDHHDRLIRRYILAKRKLIALLNEQRQAIIHRAVTRGLDPNVRLKPSGSEWLGDIPEHWEGSALKRWVATKITDGPHETPELLESGVDFLSAESMVDGEFDFERRRGFISRELHDQFCRKCRPRAWDVFMCKSGATTGKVAIVRTDREFSVWSPLALIRADRRRLDPGFLYLTLQSPYVQAQVRQTWSAGTQPNLSMGDMERLFVVLPPLSEQCAILRSLGPQLALLSTVINVANGQIKSTLDYRTRLIADVVTGKLDVREAAANLPEEPEETEELEEAESADGEFKDEEAEAEADTAEVLG